jgi:hypothetical protein
VSEVVGDKEDEADGKPENGLHPIACLKCFERSYTEEKQEDGKVGSESYRFHKDLRIFESLTAGYRVHRVVQRRLSLIGKIVVLLATDLAAKGIVQARD